MKDFQGEVMLKLNHKGLIVGQIELKIYLSK